MKAFAAILPSRLDIGFQLFTLKRKLYILRGNMFVLLRVAQNDNVGKYFYISCLPLFTFYCLDPPSSIRKQQ